MLSIRPAQSSRGSVSVSQLAVGATALQMCPADVPWTQGIQTGSHRGVLTHLATFRPFGLLLLLLFYSWNWSLSRAYYNFLPLQLTFFLMAVYFQILSSCFRSVNSSGQDTSLHPPNHDHGPHVSSTLVKNMITFYIYLWNNGKYFSI